MIEFKNIRLGVADRKLRLEQFGLLKDLNENFIEIQIAGEPKDTHGGVKMIHSSEGNRLTYVSHHIQDDSLTVIQQSPLIRVSTVFRCYTDTNAICVKTTVENICSEALVLEEVSALCLAGFGSKSSPDYTHLTSFLQSHHAECQPRKQSFRQLGLCGGVSESQRRAGHCNIGSWSTKEALPMGIIHLEEEASFFMFQIESSSSWYYEISDIANRYYLYLGGPNYPFGGWFRSLQPGQSYTTPAVSVSFGKDLNEVIANMTRYRRHIAGKCAADQKLPTIFNEYMHLSWDSPTAENTAKYAPIAAQTGVEYYVIDCGWHNEEDGDKIYPYVGHWLESNARFPEGVKKTTDYIRSLGMKPGLWIEPEIVGSQCTKMLEHYSDKCFFQRHGKRLCVMNRHFLDYREPAVQEYMSETIRRMIEDYGAEYIKCDYNQDCGIGNDHCADSPASGLEDSANAFLKWLKKMTSKYPNVIFEGCASGGMRMDYQTLSHYSLVSTSDQTDYLLYPYIAGNILAAVLPEQAAVWSYPVASDCTSGQDVSDQRIYMNMINSFLGRMHLASHLDYLDQRQLSLIQEGVQYYNTLSEIKKTAVPYFPLGFANFGDKAVCSGFKNENRIYLAVWNLKNTGVVHIPITQPICDVKLAYPSDTAAHTCINDQGVEVIFPDDKCAVFLEITTN